MKYRDIIMIFLSIALILSFAYTVGVNSSFWYISAILFVIAFITYYKLFIEK